MVEPLNELKNLSHFIVTFRLSDAPEKVLKAASYCVLDTIGSALGAVKSGEIPEVSRVFSYWMGHSEGLSADVWGQKMRMNPVGATLINGLMAHALELDDVHTGSKSHIGAVVVTTAWTLSDALGCSGKDFLAAVIVGYEVMTRIGMGMDVVSNRKRGWHTTGVIGTFGAAAVACRLLHLDEEKTLSALGMAGSQSSGLWAFLAEGSTCKKLSPARAAVNGIESALLAKGGMTGPEHILEAIDGGLYPAVSDHFDMSKVDTGLGNVYEILHIDKKPYPCCRTTHPTIDAALFLRKNYAIDPKEIKDILVETYEVGVLQCGFTHYPKSFVEAKFSIAYTCAVAFIRGQVSQSEFRGELLSNPLAQDLVAHTHVVTDKLFSDRYPGRWGSRLTVTLRDGRVLSRQIDDMSGSVASPLTEKQERDKFLGLAADCLSLEKVSNLLEEILKIQNLNRLPTLK